MYWPVFLLRAVFTYKYSHQLSVDLIYRSPRNTLTLGGFAFINLDLSILKAYIYVSSGKRKEEDWLGLPVEFSVTYL